MQYLTDRIKQFILLSDEEALLINQLFSLQHVKKGEHFLREGQVCRSLAMIKAGLVRYYIADDGNEGTYYFNSEGDFVCDYESFLPQIPSNKNIQALEDTSMYVVSHSGLQQIYRECKQGDKLGRIGLEQVFVNVIRQLSSFYTDSPSMRYQHFLDTFSGISQRVPQYYIASYVGIKPQSLSRIRKRHNGIN